MNNERQYRLDRLCRVIANMGERYKTDQSALNRMLLRRRLEAMMTEHKHALANPDYIPRTPQEICDNLR